MSGISHGSVEVQDLCGSTQTFGGEHGTSVADWTTSNKNIPASAQGVIQEVAVLVGKIGSKDFEISFDGGTTFLGLSKNTFFATAVKGGIEQLVTRSSTGTIDEEDVQLVINFEE